MELESSLLKAKLRGVATGIGARGYVAVPGVMGIALGVIGTALGVMGNAVGDFKIMSS